MANKKTPEKFDLQTFAEQLEDKTQFSIQPENPTEKQGNFYNYPTSSSGDAIMKTLGAGSKNILALPVKAKRVSNSQSITIRESGEKRQIIAKGKNTETIIEIGDVEKLIGSNKAAKKMFALALIKMNEQAYDYEDGELYKDEIEFSLQELVDMGYYSNTDSARKGFKKAMETLTSLKLRAVVKKGKNSIATSDKEISGEGILVMFTGSGVDNNLCKILLNQRVNWQPLFQYFTILPKFAFQLGNRSFDLIHSIFYLARQNNKQIKEKGYFTIGFRAIQQRLDLPSEQDNKDPQRTIREPIERSIAEITQRIKESGEENNFILTEVYDNRANIKEYLNNGYLKISFNGTYSNPFIDISVKTQKSIEVQQKRKEAIIAKAIEKKIKAD